MRKGKIIKAMMVASLVSLATLSQNAYAERSDNINITISHDTFLERVVSNYISDNSFSLDSNYYLSIPLSYDNTVNIPENCSFLFQDDIIIGKVRSYSYNGNSIVVIEDDISEDIQKMYENGESVTVASIDNCICFFSEDNDMSSYNSSLNDDENSNMTRTIQKSAQLEIPDKSRDIFEINSALLGTIKLTNVPFVGNEKVLLNGEYKYSLCWEACLATKYNYLNGGSLTAGDVYNDLGRPVQKDITMEQIVNEYKKYGMSVKLYDSTISPDSVITQLKKII